MSHISREGSPMLGETGVDRVVEQSKIIKNALRAAFFSVGVLTASYLVLPRYVAFPDDMVGALALAAVLLFAIGRVAFFLGYPHGAGARAFGMVTTVLPTLAGYVLAIVLMIGRLL